MTTSLMLTGSRREDFNGEAVEFREAGDSSLWLTAERAAKLLGLTPNAARKLFRSHKGEFLEGVEFAFASLGGNPSGADSSPGIPARRVLIFSLQGLDHLALHVTTQEGVRLRRWVVTLRENLRRGEKAIVSSPEKLLERIAALESGKASLEAQLAEARAGKVQAIEVGFDAYRELTKDAFSTIASLLARRGAMKKAEKRISGEINRVRKLFPDTPELDSLTGGN